MLLVACAPLQPHPVAIRVVGEGADDLVAAHARVGVARAPERALWIGAPEPWRAARERLGGELSEADLAPRDWYDEVLVVVPLPAGSLPSAVVVGTEEGVDVVTVDVAAAAAQASPDARSVSLLRVRRSGRQLAAVVRDQQRGSEQTVGVFLPR